MKEKKMNAVCKKLPISESEEGVLTTVHSAIQAIVNDRCILVPAPTLSLVQNTTASIWGSFVLSDLSLPEQAEFVHKIGGREMLASLKNGSCVLKMMPYSALRSFDNVVEEITISLELDGQHQDSLEGFAFTPAFLRSLKQICGPITKIKDVDMSACVLKQHESDHRVQKEVIENRLYFEHYHFFHVIVGLLHSDQDDDEGLLLCNGMKNVFYVCNGTKNHCFTLCISRDTEKEVWNVGFTNSSNICLPKGTKIFTLVR